MSTEHNQLAINYTDIGNYSTTVGGSMEIIEDWPCRFVAYHRSTTFPGDANMSPLDETIDSLAEGHRRAKEIVQAAQNRYGQQLLWIEIETLDRAGAWNALGRFYPEGPGQG